MSPVQPEHTGTPQPPRPENDPRQSQNQELALVKLYSELTGATESQARNAVIFVLGNNEEGSTPPKS